MIAEAIVLNQIFADETLKKALTEFFEAQSAMEAMVAADLMGQDASNPELARKHACFAKAYEEAMNRLREYARQV